MAEIPLVAEVRGERDQGSAASRRLRAAGRVPAVLYGHGIEPAALSVDARALRLAMSSAIGERPLFELEVDGTVHLAIPRELQRHPVRRTVAHVDFQVVRPDEVVHAEVPLHLVGEPTSVERAGGTIEHVLTSLPVQARPADLPAAIEVDLSGLEVGSMLRVGDLSAPAGVTIAADPDTVVVVAVAPRGAAPLGAEEGGSEGAETASQA
jgi:large subunit ribosomal protein L25